MGYLGLQKIKSISLFNTFHDYTKNEILFHQEDSTFKTILNLLYDVFLNLHNVELIPNYPITIEEERDIFQNVDRKKQKLAERDYKRDQIIESNFVNILLLRYSKSYFLCQQLIEKHLMFYLQNFSHLFFMRKVMEVALDIYAIVQNERNKKFVNQGNYEYQLPHGDYSFIFLPIQRYKKITIQSIKLIISRLFEKGLYLNTKQVMTNLANYINSINELVKFSLIGETSQQNLVHFNLGINFCNKLYYQFQDKNYKEIQENKMYFCALLFDNWYLQVKKKQKKFFQKNQVIKKKFEKQIMQFELTATEAAQKALLYQKYLGQAKILLGFIENQKEQFEMIEFQNLMKKAVQTLEQNLKEASKQSLAFQQDSSQIINQGQIQHSLTIEQVKGLNKEIQLDIADILGSTTGLLLFSEIYLEGGQKTQSQIKSLQAQLINNIVWGVTNGLNETSLSAAVFCWE